jgi:hypothetical protein
MPLLLRVLLRGCRDAYFSVNVLLSSHAIMGRLRRSLYVGSRTEYLSFFCETGAILRGGNW